MAATKTTQDPPITLSLPEPEPVPFPSCDVCASLVRQRAEARNRGDMSKVTDINVEIAAHPHGDR